MNETKNAKLLIYFAWLLLAVFYLYQYILRSVPGVLIEEIRQHFQLNAHDFSLMGSMYYYGYSLMQIPLGIIVDRIGIKTTAIFSVSLCIIGTLIFSTTSSTSIAYISRFISGVGSAASFMTAVKLSCDRLPKSESGIIIGATLTFGAIGALFTGAPLNYILKRLENWQEAFYVFILIGIIILLLVIFYLPKDKSKTSTQSQFNLLKIFVSIKEILANKSIIIYAVIAIGLYTPLLVIADLWGTIFIIKKFNFSREAASPILMSIYLGMAVGGIVLPFLAEKYKIADKLIQVSIFILLILFTYLVFADGLNQFELTSLLILIGFFCGSEMLCFTGALSHSNSSNSGLIIGIVNSFNMLSGAVMQQMIGLYLDCTWETTLDNNNLRIYSTKQFIEAFSILVAIIGLSALLSALCLNKKNK